MSTQAFDHRAAIFWGEFIRIAASMYAPGVTNPTQPQQFPSDWQIKQVINVEAVVPFVKQQEFIGFLAQSLQDRTNLAMVLHGSLSIFDFIDDFEFSLSRFPRIPGGQTEFGFTKLYESISFIDPVTGMSTSLPEYLKNLDPSNCVTIAGHSLGAALGILHATVLASRNIPVMVYALAPPMVGNRTFVDTYKSLVTASQVIINKPDIVPQLPGDCLGYQQIPNSIEINTLDFSEVKRSLICFHALNSYLYALGCQDSNLGTCHS